MSTIIGNIAENIIDLLNIEKPTDCNIYIGESNYSHMKNKHPQDYEKYGSKIPLILSSPDYVGINHKDNSLEYVKEFRIDNEFVKVAIRISGSSQRYYARSLYVLNPSRVNNFIEKGTLKKVF